MDKYLKIRSFKLACGLISFLVIGSLPYCWSLFVAPLEAEFEWTRTQTTTAYTIFSVVSLVGSILDGFVGTRKSPRFSLTIASFLVAAGLLICRSMTSLHMLYFGYGILCAMGVGMFYNGWLTTIADWFPDKGSFAMGILLVGYALSTAVMGSIYNVLLYSPLGWRKTFLCMAIGIGGLNLLTSRVLTVPPEDYTAQTGSPKTMNLSRTQLTPKQVMSEPAFWIQYLWINLIGINGNSLIGQGALIMGDTGAKVALATLAIGLLSAGSAAGRLLFGILFYRVGRDRVMAMIGIYVSLISLLIAVAYMVRLPVVLTILFCLYGIGYGGIATFRPSYISSVFGLKHFKRNMSYVSVFTMAFMPYMNVVGMMKTRTGSYQMYLYIMIACAVIAVLITPLNVRAIRKMEAKYSDVSTNLG